MTVDFNATTSGFATFASIGGCDVVVLMQGELVGQIQALSISISREKAPIHVMGRPDAIGYSRGKRGIAGSMVGVVLNNSWLSHALKGGSTIDEQGKTKFWASEFEYNQVQRLLGIQEDELGSNEAMRTRVGSDVPFYTARRPRQAWYVDQILPFTTVLVGANEYGGATARVITGCEILNEATGTSVDDIMLDESHTYVALHVSPYVGLEFKSPLDQSRGPEAAEDLFARSGTTEAQSIFQDGQV
jgi:hypothetical protein